MSNKLSTPNLKQKAIEELVATASQGGEADYYAGKRNWTRFADGVLLEFTTDPARPAEWKSVYMHNVSEGGCGFWSKRELPTRTAVWVREVVDGEHRPWLRAEVTHCTRGLRGHLIGVAFE